MSWRLGDNLVEGILDNTREGHVTGTLEFIGLDEPVTLDLQGDLEGELRGRRIRIKNVVPTERNAMLDRPGTYMEVFDPAQTGWAFEGYVFDSGRLHLSYNSVSNGRVVIDLPEAAWSLTELP